MDNYVERFKKRCRELRDELKPINDLPPNSVFSIRAFIDDRRKSWGGNNEYTGKTDNEIVLEKDWLAGCDGQSVYETVFGGSSEIAVKNKQNGREYIVAPSWTVPKSSFKKFTLPEVIKKAKPEDVRMAKEAYNALVKMGIIPVVRAQNPIGSKKADLAKLIKAIRTFPDFSESYILNLLNTSVTFRKGKDYFNKGRVRQITWNADGTFFTSRVQGNVLYTCSLQFNGNSLVRHTCDCPAHYNYTGPCKHIVATMLVIIAMKKAELILSMLAAPATRSTKKDPTVSAKPKETEAKTKERISKKQEEKENVSTATSEKDSVFAPGVKETSANAQSQIAKPVQNTTQEAALAPIFSDTVKVFSDLIRHMPAGEDARLYNNMRAFSEACLAAGGFEEAANYADILLAQDKNENRRIAACRVRLFAKLRCRNNEEFRHCEAFHKEMPEYLELVAACGSEAASSKLNSILKLANKTVEFAAEQKRRREEEERQRRLQAEEEERQRRLRAEEEERQRQQRREEARRKKEMRLRQAQIEAEERQKEAQRRAEQELERQRRRSAQEKTIAPYVWAGWGSFVLATLFLIAGIVLWCVFGSNMPYLFPALGWVFVAALVLYIAVFVFLYIAVFVFGVEQEAPERGWQAGGPSAKGGSGGSGRALLVFVLALVAVCVAGVVLLAVL